VAGSDPTGLTPWAEPAADNFPALDAY